MPASVTEATVPAWTRISEPLSRPRARVRSVKCDTEAMLGSASPRKPSVAIAARSSARCSLLVACRSIASRASSGSMPNPSSSTRTRRLPPYSMVTVTRRASASMAFSTSSLTIEAGRSIDLAGRDLVCEVRGQPVDAAHQSDRLPRRKASVRPTRRNRDGENPPERAGIVLARDAGQMHVHAEEAAEHGERQCDHRHEREQLHLLIEPVGHVREVRIEDAGHAILEEQRLLAQAHEVIEDVPEPVRELVGDERELTPREAADHVTLRQHDAAQRIDVALQRQDVAHHVAARPARTRTPRACRAATPASPPPGGSDRPSGR